MSDQVLEAIEHILARGDDADDVLRAVVRELAGEDGVDWCGVFFLEEGELVKGPEAGAPDEARRRRVPVDYEGTPVGELAVDGTADTALLEHVAQLVSAHVLLGWDTGGEPWES